jgi:acid phosphatase
MVIMEESQSYAATLGSCGSGSPDPYWCSLASQYASLTDWTAVEEPYSLPNYLAMTGGSTQGCTDDTCSSPDAISAEDLGGQLTQAGIPWTAYMESMPSACDTDHSDGSDPDEYAGWHDPFVYYQDDMPPNACNVLRYPGVSSMVTTLDSAGAPDFVWITPNLCHDGHDQCGPGESQQIDSWLKATLPSVLSSAWFAADGTVIITMDNGPLTTGTGGPIPTTVISANAEGKGNVAIAGDHFGTLRSIEEVYGLPLLGHASDSANGDLSQLFG